MSCSCIFDNFQLLESLHFQGFARKALAHLLRRNGGLVRLDNQITVDSE